MNEGDVSTCRSFLELQTTTLNISLEEPNALYLVQGDDELVYGPNALSADLGRVFPTTAATFVGFVHANSFNVDAYGPEIPRRSMGAANEGRHARGRI